jgi:hypothetical protein
MKPDAGRWSWRRLPWAWKIASAGDLERKGDFDGALNLLDEAEQIGGLRPSDRVLRARLLLRSQHIPEANQAFVALRNEFKGSQDPDFQYLRHYCTYMLSSLVRSSGQWAHEAMEAKRIDCHPSLERRFPMTTIDEIHERIRPRD